MAMCRCRQFFEIYIFGEYHEGNRPAGAVARPGLDQGSGADLQGIGDPGPQQGTEIGDRQEDGRGGLHRGGEAHQEVPPDPQRQRPSGGRRRVRQDAQREVLAQPGQGRRLHGSERHLPRGILPLAPRSVRNDVRAYFI